MGTELPVRKALMDLATIDLDNQREALRGCGFDESHLLRLAGLTDGPCQSENCGDLDDMHYPPRRCLKGIYMVCNCCDEHICGVQKRNGPRFTPRDPRTGLWYRRCRNCRRMATHDVGGLCDDCETVFALGAS